MNSSGPEPRLGNAPDHCDSVFAAGLFYRIVLESATVP